ncbi:MAG: hypothetical protein NT062_38315 [Proteobacteria bacterium]|nr:hypothetical protein [Pseudomonadota bacterium]
MNARLLRGSLLALLLAPTLAFAEPTADDYWKEGEQKYVLQKWDEAADAFLKGYELEADEGKKPSYLYNVAQSFRQAKKCTKSRFYYNQYLDAKRSKPLKPEKKAEVETRLAELETCAKQEADDDAKRLAADKAAAEQAAADKAAAAKAARAKQVADAAHSTGEDDPDDEVTKTTTPVGPHLVSARLLGGGSVLSAGSLTIPVAASGALIAGYPLTIAPNLTLDVGGAFTFAPSAYQVGMDSRTAMFTGVLANAGGTYWISDKMGARADVGLGLLVLSNANESPYTNGKPTTGALSMFHVRGGVSFDYVVAPNLLVTVPVAVSYSPAKSGLREDISAFTRFDFMLGVGYRM